MCGQSGGLPVQLPTRLYWRALWGRHQWVPVQPMPLTQHTWLHPGSQWLPLHLQARLQWWVGVQATWTWCVQKAEQSVWTEQPTRKKRIAGWKLLASSAASLKKYAQGVKVNLDSSFFGCGHIYISLRRFWRVRPRLAVSELKPNTSCNIPNLTIQLQKFKSLRDFCCLWWIISGFSSAGWAPLPPLRSCFLLWGPRIPNPPKMWAGKCCQGQ